MASLAHNRHAVRLALPNSSRASEHLINKELVLVVLVLVSWARRGGMRPLPRAVGAAGGVCAAKLKLSGPRCLGGWRHCTSYLVVDSRNW